MNCLRLVVAISAMTFAVFAGPKPGAAQLVVFDPNNYAQNVLTAARALQQIDRAFSTTYAPASSNLSDQALIANAQTRWQNAMAGLQDAMRTQATVVGNLNTNRSQMSALVTSSQGATGALQASQAGNQLLALQA